jgi:hypothetical protein
MTNTTLILTPYARNARNVWERGMRTAQTARWHRAMALRLRIAAAVYASHDSMGAAMALLDRATESEYLATVAR